MEGGGCVAVVDAFRHRCVMCYCVCSCVSGRRVCIGAVCVSVMWLVKKQCPTIGRKPSSYRRLESGEGSSL